MNKTKIDWKDLGFTWNPIVGCANNCSYCYARKISNRFKMIPDFTKPVFFHDRIDQPIKVKKPSTIFVGSMCDIFSDGVGEVWIKQIIETVKNCPQHKFMFLTKKPENYSLFRWPENAWLGTTIEKRSMIMRSAYMNGMPNRKFISIEPILSGFTGFPLEHIDLVIVGADSTPGATIPPIEWIKSIQHKNIWYKANLRKHYPELNNYEP